MFYKVLIIETRMVNYHSVFLSTAFGQRLVGLTSMKKMEATLLAGSACALSMLSARLFAKITKLVFIDWGPYINGRITKFTDETGIKVIYSTYRVERNLVCKAKTQQRLWLGCAVGYFVSKVRDGVCTLQRSTKPSWAASKIWYKLLG